MKIKNLPFILVLVLLTSVFSFAQINAKKPTISLPTTLNKSEAVKSSPAYAEVLLQKTELWSELESLLIEYTEEYPKVTELRFEIGVLQKELDKLLAVNPAESGKLTTALGKLMVRKCELETDLWSLQKQYNDQHPEVKRAKRKAEIFEAAINEILQPVKKSD
jgi:peptidoglycan hydrolase CwlO-like protein